MTKLKIYSMLCISILTEVFAATMLKLSNGFEFLIPLIGVALGYSISFAVLGILLKSMPLSIAYAIWAGVGTVLTALVSAFLFNEEFTLLKIIGLLIIIIGIIVLNLNYKVTDATKQST